MERPPEEETQRVTRRPQRSEIRHHRHHRHHLRRKVIRGLGWTLLVLAGSAVIYYVFGWISEGTYALERMVW